ncbi:Uncharacterised protein [Chryseobacterium nakagawai]|nr:Uncharacterised protein [Chryseobacterium nakagawai]
MLNDCTFYAHSKKFNRINKLYRFSLKNKFLDNDNDLKKITKPTNKE